MSEHDDPYIISIPNKQFSKIVRETLGCDVVGPATNTVCPNIELTNALSGSPIPLDTILPLHLIVDSEKYSGGVTITVFEAHMHHWGISKKPYRMINSKYELISPSISLKKGLTTEYYKIIFNGGKLSFVFEKRVTKKNV